MENCGCMASVLKLSNQIRREMNYMTEYSGIQTYILFFLLEAGETQAVYQKDLERTFNTCSASISSTLKKMEKEGLIVRRRVPGDDRLKRVLPTSQAMEMKRHIDETICLLERQMTEDIGAEKLEVFTEVSEQMLQNMTEKRR